jgi:hypothetical protein
VPLRGIAEKTDSAHYEQDPILKTSDVQSKVINGESCYGTVSLGVRDGGMGPEHTDILDAAGRHVKCEYFTPRVSCT